MRRELRFEKFNFSSKKEMDFLFLKNIFSSKGTLWLGIFLIFFRKHRVKGCLVMPGIEPSTLRFPAGCHDHLARPKLAIHNQILVCTNLKNALHFV